MNRWNRSHSISSSSSSSSHLDPDLQLDHPLHVAKMDTCNERVHGGQHGQQHSSHIHNTTTNYNSYSTTPTTSTTSSHSLASTPHHFVRSSSSSSNTTTTTTSIIDYILHITRRAARQVTSSSSSSSSSSSTSPSASPSKSPSNYLPLYIYTAKTKIKTRRQSCSSATTAGAKLCCSGTSRHDSSEKETEEGAPLMQGHHHSSLYPQDEKHDHHEHGSSSSSSRHNRRHSANTTYQSLRSTCCPSSSSSSTSRPTSSSHLITSKRTCSIILCLCKLIILCLALLGTTTIVGFATGLVQKTPLYTEKVLQDTGWARRPITLSSSSPSVEGENTRQKDIYAGVTIQDFSPISPSLSALSSSSSSSSSLDISSLDSSSPQTGPIKSNELHLLILCPLRNASPDLPHLFKLLDSLDHPKSNTSLGFLVGDEDDDTGNVLHRLVRGRMIDDDDDDERSESYTAGEGAAGGADGPSLNEEESEFYEEGKQQGIRGENRLDQSNDDKWRHVSLLHKDFGSQMSSGVNRHAYPVQLQRR
jgi:hypothetical protein